MRIFVTGGSGVLGRATLPLLAAAHEVDAPAHGELDLFDAAAVAARVRGADAVMHLATRIPLPERRDEPGAWRENDRLRAEASRLLVDAALAASADVYVEPSVAFLYPDGPADEDAPLVEPPERLRSALAAEEQARRFAASGRRGVILRLGLLDGPGTGNTTPNHVFGATLHIDDAGRALVAALSLPSGVYNVCRDGERVRNDRFKQATGWRPER